MALIKDLLNWDKKKKHPPRSAILVERRAAAMGWQILNYPYMQDNKGFKIYKNLRGVMLADEVGGGKTFETLAIVSKSLLESVDKKNRMNRFRVLIVANPAIRSKWMWDEAEKGIEYEKLKGEHYNPKSDLSGFIRQTKIRKPAGEKLIEFFSSTTVLSKKKEWKGIEVHNQGIWLTSFLSLPKTKGSGRDAKFNQDGRKTRVFPYNYFDWIIVDEAHSVKRGGSDEGESQFSNDSSVRKIQALMHSSPCAQIILLTATPFQNNTAEFKHLISLLERKNEKDVSLSDLVSRGIAKLDEELLNLNDGKLKAESIGDLYKKFNNDLCGLINHKEKIVRPAKLHINKAKNGLDDFLRDFIVRNNKDLLKIEAIEVELKDREQFQYLLFRSLVKADTNETQMVSTKLSQLVSGEESFSKKRIRKKDYENIIALFGENLIAKMKLKSLNKIIEDIKISKIRKKRTVSKPGKHIAVIHPKKVITVYVSWLPTVDELYAYYDNKEMKKKKYKVYRLTSKVKTINRDKMLRTVNQANRNTNYEKIILLASRVGNEGLDFDKFCNRVIHFDNNFNPAVIDQRNGRVYRNTNIKTVKSRGKNNGKVTADDIEIYQLYLKETYDQRIVFIEKEKRKMKNFYLGDSSLEKIFEDAVIKSDPKERKEIIKTLEKFRIDLTPMKLNLLKQFKKEV